jgi:hypothetical protein
LPDGDWHAEVELRERHVVALPRRARLLSRGARGRIADDLTG